MSKHSISVLRQAVERRNQLINSGFLFLKDCKLTNREKKKVLKSFFKIMLLSI